MAEINVARNYEISVVIPVRDRRLDLERCLSALQSQDFPKEKFEVIVCDDGSTENLSEIVHKFKETGLALLHLRQEAKGPAAARNMGILKAGASIIALTDSDTFPDSNWLSKLYSAFLNNPNALGVEGAVLADNEHQFKPLGEGPINKEGGVYLTCNCAYRRSTLIEAGGFDESFPYPAYEDTEIAARVLQLGAIIWQPEAIIIHPQRPLTLKTVLKKLRHWDYVLLMGFRYGYLAWRQYPVTYPRIRVAVLSVIALPLAKVKTALSALMETPLSSLKLLFFAMAESMGALFYVVPKALFFSYKKKIPRQSFLNQFTS